MAVVRVQNGFLCLDSWQQESSRRCRSESPRRVRSSLDSEEELPRLQAVLDEAIAREGCEASKGLLQGLSKLRIVRSNASVSTMAPEDESLGSSSPRWADSDDEVPTKAVVPARPKESKSGAVPRLVNLAEGFAKQGGPITTVMIRNIPNRCGQQELISELEAAGFQGCFDFLYIPLDLGTMSNVGFAFVNFTHPSHALRCMQELPQRRFRRQRAAGKALAVLPAHIQGLEANLRHYEKSAVNTSRLRQRRPVVMNVFNTVA